MFGWYVVFQCLNFFFLGVDQTTCCHLLCLCSEYAIIAENQEKLQVHNTMHCIDQLFLMRKFVEGWKEGTTVVDTDQRIIKGLCAKLHHSNWFIDVIYFSLGFSLMPWSQNSTWRARGKRGKKHWKRQMFTEQYKVSPYFTLRGVLFLPISNDLIGHFLPCWHLKYNANRLPWLMVLY